MSLELLFQALDIIKGLNLHHIVHDNLTTSESEIEDSHLLSRLRCDINAHHMILILRWAYFNLAEHLRQISNNPVHSAYEEAMHLG